MGRIKTSLVKHLGREIFDEHAKDFSTDFNENKKIVAKFVYMKSKKQRNILVGYITTLKKQQRG